MTRRPAAMPRRRAGVWPFTAGSPWNTPIGSGATYTSSSDPATASILNTTYGPGINHDNWSHPIDFATNSDPLCTVTEDGGRQIIYRIPSSATPDPQGDAHMHVISPDGLTVYEQWLMARTSSTTFSCGYEVTTSLYSDGLNGGVRAYGGSAIGGLIRKHEIANRHIPHPIAFAIQGAQLKQGWVWPASTEDGDSASSYTGQAPMGTLVAIPPAVDITTLGLNADALALARAFQDYGGYVTDRGGGFTCYVENGADGTRVGNMSAGLATIRAQVRRVSNNTAGNVGGGGVRRRPAAPRLSAG